MMAYSCLISLSLAFFNFLIVLDYFPFHCGVKYYYDGDAKNVKLVLSLFQVLQLKLLEKYMM